MNPAARPHPFFLPCRDGKGSDPPQEPLAELCRLAELYRRGLQAPLPFFPKSSYAFAEATLVKNREFAAAAGSAADRWNGSEFIGPGEKEDSYFAFCFGSDPVWSEHDNDAASCRIALEIWRPFFACMQELEV